MMQAHRVPGNFGRILSSTLFFTLTKELSHDTFQHQSHALSAGYPVPPLSAGAGAGAGAGKHMGDADVRFAGADAKLAGADVKLAGACEAPGQLELIAATV